MKVVDGTLTLNVGNGAAFGSGANGGGVGDITVENSTVTVEGGVFAGIGAGYNHSTAGNIVVTHSTVRDPNSVDTCIGSGYSGSSCGSILVQDSIVEAHNSDSALVGAGDASGTCLDITVDNSEVVGSSNHGAAVGSGRAGSRAGDVYIKNGSRIVHSSPDGAAIGSGLGGHVGTIYISSSSLEQLDASHAFQAPDHVIPGVGHGRDGSAGDVSGVTDVEDDEPGEETEEWYSGKPLVIHTGTKANEALYCWIEDLGLDALGIRDAELVTQQKASELLGDPMRPDEPGPIDRAINYALNEITQLGAYLSRLDETEETLVTAEENTTGAESRIRDADMAKEMLAYTKSQILSQGSQGMLAQANQNAASVLGLLQ